MDRTGRGSSSVNAALSGLEEKNLIRREQRSDPKTHQRLPTCYILGFEFANPREPTPNSGGGFGNSGGGTKCEQSAEPTPNNGDGAISGFTAKPSPVFGQSHLLKTGVAYKDEPVREPVREPVSGDTQKSENSNLQEETPLRVSNSDTGGKSLDATPPPALSLNDAWEEFVSVYPRIGHVDETREALRLAIEQGHDPLAILAGARAYAAEQEGNKRQYLALSQNWLAQKRWEGYQTPKPATPIKADDELIRSQRVDAIKAGRSWVASLVSPSYARELVEAGLVTPDECKRAGVHL